MNKTYLGDSVYAELDGDRIKLTTENGYPDDPRNVIYLEPEVVLAFQEYIIYLNKLADLQKETEV